KAISRHTSNWLCKPCNRHSSTARLKCQALRVKGRPRLWGALAEALGMVNSQCSNWAPSGVPEAEACADGVSCVIRRILLSSTKSVMKAVSLLANALSSRLCWVRDDAPTHHPEG